MIGEESVCLYFLYINLIVLGTEVPFINGSTVTYNEIHVLKYPFQGV